MVPVMTRQQQDDELEILQSPHPSECQPTSCPKSQLCVCVVLFVLLAMMVESSG